MATGCLGVHYRIKVPERWRVPPLRYHESAAVQSPAVFSDRDLEPLQQRGRATAAMGPPKSERG
eukprot:77519-Alexandrium_andersonii.AAC.1